MSFFNLRRKRPVEPSERRFAQGEWMSAPEWISVREAADLSGYDIQHVQRLLRQGKVSAEKKGGHDWWVDKASLQAYVKKMKSLGTDKYNAFRNSD